MAAATGSIFVFQQKNMQTNRTYTARDVLRNYVIQLLKDNKAIQASAAFAGNSQFPSNTMFNNCISGAGGPSGAVPGRVTISPSEATGRSAVGAPGELDGSGVAAGGGPKTSAVTVSAVQCKAVKAARVSALTTC